MKTGNLRLSLIYRSIVFAIVALIVDVTPSYSAVFHCSAGDTQCLINSIVAANSNHKKNNVIHLAAGSYTLTAGYEQIDLFDSVGLPSITGTVTIRGAGREATSIERSPGAGFGITVIHVSSTGRLTLDSLTVRRGNGNTLAANVDNEGVATLTNVGVVEGLHDGFSAGGVHNAGTMSITDSVIANNTGHEGQAGGIFNDGDLTIERTMIVSNHGPDGTAGIWNGLHNRRASLTLSRSTVAENIVSSLPVIINEAVMRITESNITGNTGSGSGCPPGGNADAAVRNSGVMTITNTTIANNNNPTAAVTNGGASLTIVNSTIARNFSEFACVGTPLQHGNTAGVANLSTGVVELVNTIVAEHQPQDCVGVVTSLGNNLFTDVTGCTIVLQNSDLIESPGLGVFTDNGTPGNGHIPLLRGSPAIDAGDAGACPRIDQLGRRRVGPCDIGAVRFPEGREREDREDSQ